ncbi:MAG: hypothetical protein NZ551_02530 [Microscillaceae bacterium]|nr:hypothetical protein [Microscillaceae bacterium]MDW8460062.1 hypothetical protein [Cytophagales bacterium]
MLGIERASPKGLVQSTEALAKPCKAALFALFALRLKGQKEHPKITIGN